MSIKAVVFDLYGTLGREDEETPALPEGPLRNGSSDLLRELKQMPLPVFLFTDYPYPDKHGFAEEQRFIKDILTGHRIINYFERIYTGSDCDEEGLKNMGRVSEEYEVQLSEILLIGNGQKDEESSAKYGTRFMWVPTCLRGDTINIRDYVKGSGLYNSFLKQQPL